MFFLVLDDRCNVCNTVQLKFEITKGMAAMHSVTGTASGVIRSLYKVKSRFFAKPCTFCAQQFLSMLIKLQ